MHSVPSNIVVDNQLLAGPPSALAQVIDHTNLRPDAVPDDIIQLCCEAKEYGFAGVCVNPSYVSLSRDTLAGSNVRTGTVIGFPGGGQTPETKAFEALRAIEAGADELDIVINVGMLKSRNYAYILDELCTIVSLSRERNRSCVIKVILETCLLSDREKVVACVLAVDAGADFVKTSTGFSTSGATLYDVALMRSAVGVTAGVKASGGIRTLEQVRAFLRHGANRIGTSSGVEIIHSRH